MTDKEKPERPPIVQPFPIGDIPVVCTRSGEVMILDAVAVFDGDPEETIVIARAAFLERGINARIEGRVCSYCRFESSHMISSDTGRPIDKKSCEYRALRGPLFAPR